ARRPDLHPACTAHPAQAAQHPAGDASSVMSRRLLPRLIGQIGVFVAFFACWEVLVDLLQIKPVILPAPSLIFVTMAKHWSYLLVNTWPTLLAITGGFVAAAVLG